MVFFGKGKKLMRGWRSKFIFMLIVFFAGFATAIYILAPVPEGQDGQQEAKGLLDSTVKSGDFVQSFNAGLHKAVNFSKDAAQRTAKFLKKINEGQQKSTG